MGTLWIVAESQLDVNSYLVCLGPGHSIEIELGWKTPPKAGEKTCPPADDCKLKILCFDSDETWTIASDLTEKKARMALSAIARAIEGGSRLFDLVTYLKNL